MNRGNLRDFMFITFGVFLVAISVVYFFQPNNIAAGGVSGIAIIINNFVPGIPIGLLVLMMDCILYIVAFLVIGSKFGGKSIYASLTLSGIMWLLEKVFPYKATNDLMLATILGTIISALGLAIVFNCNASTGGTDILAKILHKFFHFNIGKSLLIVDFIVTLAGAMTFGVQKGLYAVLAVIISGFAIDKAIAGFNICNEVTIISKESKKISEFILNDLGRGCTFINGIGGFTEKQTTILYTVIGRSEFIKLKRYISQIDNNAFITVSEVAEVMGEGFKEINGE